MPISYLYRKNSISLPIENLLAESYIAIMQVHAGLHEG